MSRTIFVDVDGTLVNALGEPNRTLIAWIRWQKAHGHTFNLWSMRGKDYALQIAQRLEVAELFDAVLSKPNFIVDDKTWTWIRFTRCIFGEEIERGGTL